MSAALVRACLRRASLACMLSLAAVLVAVPAGASARQTAAIQAHLLWDRYDRPAVQAQLDRARDAGAGMVRVDLGWSSLEKDGKGRYDPWYLGKIDHVVSQAEARGLKVLFTFWETPCWASTAPDSIKQGCSGAWWDRGVQRYAPANAAHFGDALAFLVRRYRMRVAAWEIWNEPNHPEYFKASDEVGAYAALVRAAYPAAKAADSRATVIAGSLADADYGFTESLLSRGVKGKFDAWSVHPYSEDRSPLHPGFAGWAQKSFVGGVPRVRDTLLRHGQDRPLWLTEFGWSTCNVRNSDRWSNCVDPSVQARYLQEAYRQMQRWSYVRVGTWFNLQDTSSDEGDRVDNYGLFDHDGRPKPSYAAYQVTAAAFYRGSPVPTGRRTGRRSRRITLRVRRRRGRVHVSGVLPVGRTLWVKAHRQRRGSRRFHRRASYRLLIRVGRGGRFRARIKSRGLRRGRWRIVVRNRRSPRLTAARVLR